MYKPLADEIRPASLDDVVGQRHILGPNGMLRRIVESGQIPNMIFYGPSGTGKTGPVPDGRRGVCPCAGRHRKT